MTNLPKKQRIVDLWNEGYNIVQIGMMVKVTKQYVSLVLLEAGINPRADRMAKPIEERLSEQSLDILNLFRAGFSPRAISRKLGTSSDYVSSMAIQYLTPDERIAARALRSTQTNKIRQMYADGMRITEIARALGLTPQNVWSTLNRKYIKETR